MRKRRTPTLGPPGPRTIGERMPKGSWGAEFYEVLPEENDIIVNKHRYSAFVNTRLVSVLKTLKIETLIMTGVSTNVRGIDGKGRFYARLSYRACLTLAHRILQRRMT